jgi:carbon monoxide dehydrogenase subunit G
VQRRLKRALIDLTVSGGTGPFTYDWSNDGAETPDNDPQDLNNLAAGTYTVTVTDANNCTATTSATITQPTAIALSVTPANSTCGSANGSINLTVSGGTPSYTYAWSNSSTIQDPTGLLAGTYTVTVTDANGCTKTTSATVNNTGGPSLSTTKVNVLCNGASTGSIDLAVSGGTGPFTYDWSNDGAETPDNDPQDLNNLAAGTYTVTVTDANNCTATTSATITQPTAIALSVTPANSTCGSANGSINLTVSGGTPSYTYAWSNSSTIQDPTGLLAGTYTVTVTDANGCTKTTSATVNNTGGPSLSTTQVNVLCNGASTGSIEI